MNEFKPWKEKKFPPSSRKLLKEHSWMRRNPVLFSSIFTGGCLLILFSRPLYDAFFRDMVEGREALPSSRK